MWGRSYTELFFLDEVTALAAGHRPCFQCRRRDAQAFADRWQHALGLKLRPRASEIDEVLHAERLDGRDKRRHRRAAEELPDGAVVVADNAAYAVRGDMLMRWTPEGYAFPMRRPRGDIDVLTPPAILGVLGAGYAPRWHPSSER